MNTVTHQPAVKPTTDHPTRYVACCDCGWQDKRAYFYPAYAASRAEQHKERHA